MLEIYNLLNRIKDSEYNTKIDGQDAVFTRYYMLSDKTPNYTYELESDKNDYENPTRRVEIFECKYGLIIF